eukprot:429680_1
MDDLVDGNAVYLQYLKQFKSRPESEKYLINYGKTLGKTIPYNYAQYIMNNPPDPPKNILSSTISHNTIDNNHVALFNGNINPNTHIKIST